MKVKIHCFEGEWDSEHPELSIRPLMHVLEQAYLSVSKQLVYTFKFCQTLERLRANLRLDGRRFSNKTYQHCLYFAFHGNGTGLANYDGGEYISFKEIADAIGSKAAGSIILFGSCGSYTSQSELELFKQQTGAALVVGYSAALGWIESSMFEMLFFSELCRYKQIGSFKNKMQKLAGKDQLLFSKLKVRLV